MESALGKDLEHREMTGSPPSLPPLEGEGGAEQEWWSSDSFPDHHTSLVSAFCNDPGVGGKHPET